MIGRYETITLDPVTWFSEEVAGVAVANSEEKTPPNGNMAVTIFIFCLFLAACLFVCLSTFHLSVGMSVCLYLCLSVCLSIYLSIHLSVCVCMNVSPKIYIEIYIYINNTIINSKLKYFEHVIKRWLLSAVSSLHILLF